MYIQAEEDDETGTFDAERMDPPEPDSDDGNAAYDREEHGIFLKDIYIYLLCLVSFIHNGNPPLIIYTLIRVRTCLNERRFDLCYIYNIGYLSSLMYLATVLISQAPLAKRQFPNSWIWDHPLFKYVTEMVTSIGGGRR